VAEDFGLINIGKNIEAYLPPEILALVKAAGNIAASKGQRAYLVGGVVRDIFLKRRNLDLDLVVEGDALQLARQLAKGGDGKLVTHPRFGTATFKQGTFSLDVVTARSETYAEPGALPTVKPGSIQDDLFRRDFSINAMAASIDPAHFGDLVDPYGGKSDLDRHLIRVLHQRSFKEDPTRVWRALRYEQRLGFRLEFDTTTQLRRDATIMDRISGDRLRHELGRILEEDYPEKVFYRAEWLGVLRHLHPALEGNGWLGEHFDMAREASGGAKPDMNLYLALLAWRLNDEALKSFMERLKFGSEAARMLRDITGLKQALPSLVAPELTPSGIYHILERHRPETIMAASLVTDSALVKQRLELYLSNLRFVELSLSGDNLRKMGVPAGKKMGALLKALKEAKLDGKVTTREDEKKLVRSWLKKGKR
jgi:tRNA nucleotidyltransferase (CCA-adding enzyme)